MRVKQAWSEFKASIADKKLFIQYYDRTEYYEVWASDGSSIYRCVVNKDGGADQSDFETNYKPDANRPQTVAESATRSNFVGKQIVVPSGIASAYCEWENDDKVYVRQVFPIVADAEWGDKIEFTVHLKENDYAVGGYAQDIYLYRDKPDKWFMGLGAGEIPSSCKVRCTYIKGEGTTESERKFIVIAEFLT